MRTMLSLAIVAALLLGACSSSGDDDTEAAGDTPEPTEEPTAEPTEEPTPEPTEEPTPEPTEEPTEEPTPEPEEAAEEPAEEAAAAGGSATVEVTLTEWAVDAPETLPAGTIEFAATNIGDFPHEMAIAVADDIASLPTLANGAVDEDLLGADLLGRIERMDGGVTTTGTFDLAPGNYVLFCNIAVGPNSHFANGQALAVTVG